LNRATYSLHLSALDFPPRTPASETVANTKLSATFMLSLMNRVCDKVNIKQR
jgi:hypothetical protein